jgi:Ca2+-binding EF-hand superfamily protein
MTKLDLNKDGTLNFAEFKPYFINTLKRLDNLDILKKRVLYNNLSIDSLDETVQKVFDEADQDNNGYLDTKEFSAFMYKICLMLNLPPPN